MLTVRQLEQLLFDVFPVKDATHEDRIGLFVGDPDEEVKAIALALDAKVADIEAAAAEGCNVLVTHHPVYWIPPTEFLARGASAGASIYYAAKLGVALINMHTNLDSAPAAREMLLGPAGYTYSSPIAIPSELDSELQEREEKSASILIEIAEAISPVAALGQLGIPAGDTISTLGEIAARYKETFGALAKVWGNPDKPIRLLATCSGSGGSLISRVIDSGADCYVTGEVAYHEALELAHFGIALIELGHDRSELPYRRYLYQTLVSLGIDESIIRVIEPTASWWD